MKISVDWTACESHALCMGAAPEVFEVGDDDTLTVLQEQPSEELREKVMKARGMCPVQAITVTA
ncbi:ferredoxin [Mycobacterium sp. C31M]